MITNNYNPYSQYMSVRNSTVAPVNKVSPVSDETTSNVNTTNVPSTKSNDVVSISAAGYQALEAMQTTNTVEPTNEVATENAMESVTEVQATTTTSNVASSSTAEAIADLSSYSTTELLGLVNEGRVSQIEYVNELATRENVETTSTQQVEEQVEVSEERVAAYQKAADVYTKYATQTVNAQYTQQALNMFA